ncbi:4'-phosphopantetheinyl transferase family protein [Streptomyces sp. MSC1_001]|uniref:4'-phosphopantetheinyl transferase family protein n=1 Tax=Streptomyces sp. MSC1_001 TaxID=2909263 RepID=UPI0020301C5D|nr:4'-phosphopantetheinyl transferase superfamily protein [Streptomyces sp. MSC1_001]
MIEELIPAPASAVHAFHDCDSAVGDLFPEEAAAVARALPKRRQEYAVVRMCARRAMSALGFAAVALVTGERGAPRWPAGLVGSMTHCAGYRAAVVGRASDYRGLGIDAEPNAPLDDEVLEFVSSPRERARLRALAASVPEVCWDRLLFSAKESVFKVWYPLTGRELDFGDADVRIDPEAGTFTADVGLPDDGPDGEHLKVLEGRWLCRDGLVVTAVTLRRG